MPKVAQLPSWVEHPLNQCTERVTKEKLKFAIDSIESSLTISRLFCDSIDYSINRQLTKDSYLQTVADFVFPLLVEEFKDLKFGMKYVYAPQLKYSDIKADRNFLSTNLNNNARYIKADVAILIVLPNGKKFPILVGELKTKVYFKELTSKDGLNDYLQLFNFMLTVQRPYRVNGNKSHVIRFLMDYEEAFIFRLPVGFWTNLYIFPTPSLEEFLQSPNGTCY